MSTSNTSAETLTTNPYLARLRSALLHHNVAQSNFGKNIFDELEVVACEVVAEGKEFSTVLAKPTKGEKLTPRKGVVTTVGDAEGGKGKRGRVVIEATVKKDWLNPVGGLHGAATAYLVDICTSLAVVTISTSDFWPGLGGVSQNLVIHYAGPAFEGDRIRIDSTTLNVGKMVANMRCDITNAKTGALIAAGTHTKVDVFSRTKGRLNEVVKRVGYDDATKGKVVAKL